MENKKCLKPATSYIILLILSRCIPIRYSNIDSLTHLVLLDPTIDCYLHIDWLYPYTLMPLSGRTQLSDIYPESGWFYTTFFSNKPILDSSIIFKMIVASRCILEYMSYEYMSYLT